MDKKLFDAKAFSEKRSLPEQEDVLDYISTTYEKQKTKNVVDGSFWGAINRIFEDGVYIDLLEGAKQHVEKLVTAMIEEGDVNAVLLTFPLMNKNVKKYIAQNGEIEMAFALSCEYGGREMAGAINATHKKLIRQRVEVIRKRLPELVEMERVMQTVMANTNIKTDFLKNGIIDIQVKVLSTLEPYILPEEAFALVQAAPNINFLREMKAKMSAENIEKNLKITARRPENKRKI